MTIARPISPAPSTRPRAPPPRRWTTFPSLGLPRHLKDVKVSREDLPRLAENCMLDDWTYSNPRPIRSPAEIMEILQAAY